MKFIIILTFLAVAINAQNGIGCRWRYKCCELVNGSCLKMCEPKVECPENITTEPTFASFQALNVKCKYGFKFDTKHNCRRVLK